LREVPEQIFLGDQVDPGFQLRPNLGAFRLHDDHGIVGLSKGGARRPSDGYANHCGR
jgi:hypothetical protein